MKIGNVTLKNGFLLAPMANFSTPAFRRLCHDYGTGLTTSEMVSSEAVVHRNGKTESHLARAKDERPYAIQIVGSEPLSISLAATVLQGKCEIIDINLGCPASSITDQYLPSIAAAAPIPASTAQPGRRVSNERRNHHVAAAHSGVSTVLALNLSARKL